jgi:hypothetical protein
MRPLPSFQAVPDANLTLKYNLLNVGDQLTLCAEPMAACRKASLSFWRGQSNRCAFQPPTTYLDCLGTTLGDTHRCIAGLCFQVPGTWVWFCILHAANLAPWETMPVSLLGFGDLGLFLRSPRTVQSLASPFFPSAVPSRFGDETAICIVFWSRYLGA